MGFLKKLAKKAISLANPINAVKAGVKMMNPKNAVGAIGGLLGGGKKKARIQARATRTGAMGATPPVPAAPGAVGAPPAAPTIGGVPRVQIRKINPLI